MIKNCLRCNKEFYTKPARIKDGKGKYCSVPCYKGPKIDKVCAREECNNEFKVPPSLNRIMYCSRSCVKKGRPNPTKGIPRFHLRGEAHWNWKSSNRTERSRAMGQIEYKLWRKAVFERDDYTCQMCFTRGFYLEADHIKPWISYPELRYAIDNGRTLCRECHKTTNSWGFKGILRAERSVM